MDGPQAPIGRFAKARGAAVLRTLSLRRAEGNPGALPEFGASPAYPAARVCELAIGAGDEQGREEAPPDRDEDRARSLASPQGAWSIPSPYEYRHPAFARRSTVRTIGSPITAK